MLKPPYLKSGDKVALISPAGVFDRNYLANAIAVLKSWKLIPIVGRFALEQYGYFAGTDTQRLSDLQWALDNDEIRAIFCNRGGYGTLRIVEQVDYSKFQGNPKWIIGFSDITVLHTKINSLGFESIHGAMPKTFSSTSTGALVKLKEFLFGKISSYTLPPHPYNREGIVQAELTGGNLTLVHAVAPTCVCYHHRTPILFIEDVNEDLYAIDRMLQSLKMSSCFDSLQGVIVGAFTEIAESGYGKTCYEVIDEVTRELNVPVCFNFPAGHLPDNYPLIMGSTIELSIDQNGTEITFV